MAASPTLRSRRPREDGVRSRKAILDAAAKLATVEGLEGLSIGRLAEHVGMSKSGLYAHFGSKEELQLATVETAAQLFDSAIVEPAEAVGDPLGRLEALCEGFLAYLERRVFPGGCFFASAAAEFDTHPGPVRERLAGYQRGWLARLEDEIRQAQQRGQIAAEEDPAQLAFEVDAYLLMANQGFILTNDPQMIEHARRALRARLSPGPAA